MPGIIINGILENHENDNMNSSPIKENMLIIDSPSSNSEALELPMENCLDTSIDHLYNNICEMESSGDDMSLSRQSFGSGDNESRIDSELRHLLSGEKKATEVIEEDEEIDSSNVQIPSPTVSISSSKKSRKKSQSPYSTSKPPLRGIIMKKIKNGSEDSLESTCFLLKHAHDLISSNNHKHALKYAVRAANSFEKLASEAPNLDLIMSLHVIAAIHCNLGNFNEAVPILGQSIETSKIEQGQDYVLAKISGLMQLGDTYAMLGQLESSLQFYNKGFEIQKQALGITDIPRVGETCRYVAEALVQALQFDEAEKLWQMALDIHKDGKENASLEEAVDHRLMSIICDTKGDHETALEHLVLASTAMLSNGLESEVASVDLGIGDMYLSLDRYDGAVVSRMGQCLNLRKEKVIQVLHRFMFAWLIYTIELES